MAAEAAEALEQLQANPETPLARPKTRVGGEGLVRRRLRWALLAASVLLAAAVSASELAGLTGITSRAISLMRESTPQAAPISPVEGSGPDVAERQPADREATLLAAAPPADTEKPGLYRCGKDWPMFVVPALAGIRAKNRLKAGLQTVRFQPRTVSPRRAPQRRRLPLRMTADLKRSLPCASSKDIQAWFVAWPSRLTGNGPCRAAGVHWAIARCGSGTWPAARKSAACRPIDWLCSLVTRNW